MRFMPLLFCGISACSTRHLEGFDRFQEVCASAATLFELGTIDLACNAPAGPGGLLRLQVVLPDPLQVPFRAEASELYLGEWCPQDMNSCIPIATGHLVLSAYEDGIATSGRYDFLLQDGTKITGEIAAQFCDTEGGC
jgi:hypothetical protein